jgi:MinD-like ATPase involved in chromosome partitioning or flagellar assembly
VETVAFYSYKGGVGRSQLLAHAARFLAGLGKGVVALDFDFEAPGLHYKLRGDQTSGSPIFAGGAVPYLLATADGAESAPPLEDHTIPVPVPANAFGWLRLMPAGPAPHQTYWAVLKALGDKLRPADPSGRGFMAILDLQARIQDELKPDYLLIDARTGVTEIGSLATTILADTVVCMFVGNLESLDGTLAIIEALKNAPRLTHQKPIRVVPVLSRATEVDNNMADSVRTFLGEKDLPLFVLPHDQLAAAENLLSSPLFIAYHDLFRELFSAK